MDKNAMHTANGEVDALLRRFYSMSRRAQLDSYAALRSYLSAPDRASSFDDDIDERRSALAVMALAAKEIGLAPLVAPTARQFNDTDAARDAGWSAARVAAKFGRWSFACDDFRGGRPRPTAAQRGAERKARRGVYRERDDYLRGLRLWIDTNPVCCGTDDYELWRKQHNHGLPPGELRLVSYSMLRKAFHCDWPDLIEVALGALALDVAEARSKRQPLLANGGPDDLVAFSTVRQLLDASTTSAQRITRSPTFPPPAYTHPQPPRQRLWRRTDVVAYVEGRPFPRRGANELQGRYLDARAVALALGLATITATTGSSPRVPEPAVRLAGLQLWLRQDVLPA